MAKVPRASKAAWGMYVKDASQQAKQRKEEQAQAALNREETNLSADS